MPHDDILQNVSRYYSGKVTTHGATHWGVDWNSTESQELRFEQLLKLHTDKSQPFSINDYGCGYGALISYLNKRGFQFTYIGFDVSHAMIDKARELYGDLPNCTFTTDANTLVAADYTIASGIFSVKQDTANEQWQQYILDTMDTLWALSANGMGFNALTKYSDADKMRPNLFYADPTFLFDRCKTHYSRHVALLHDYGLYEFTMLVRR